MSHAFILYMLRGMLVANLLVFYLCLCRALTRDPPSA